MSKTNIDIKGQHKALRHRINQALENRSKNEEDWLIELVRSNKYSSIRRSAIVALRELQSIKAIPVLISLLTTEIKNQNLRETAIKALGEVGNEMALPILKDLAESEPVAKFGRQAAVKAFTRLEARLSEKQRASEFNMVQKIIKVFISYKWEDEAHNKWVEKFATGLRHSGIDAILDRWEVRLGDSFTDYMTSKIHEADVVLFIMTTRSVAAAEAPKGGGGAVKFELQMATSRRIAGENMRLIGIYREGNQTVAHLRDHRYADFRDDSKYNENLKELIDDLLGIEKRPPLQPRIDPSNQPQLISKTALPPTDELDNKEMSILGSKPSSFKQDVLKPTGLPEYNCKSCGAVVQSDERDHRSYHCSNCGASDQWWD